MFLRMVLQSLRRRWSRKLVAVLAVWIGTSLVVGLLVLSLEVGDRMNREMSSFGANIRVEPLGAAVDPRLGGAEIASGAASTTLDESAFAVLKNEFFWRNNIQGIVPRLWTSAELAQEPVPVLGLWLERALPVEGAEEDFVTGARHVYGHWSIQGDWPSGENQALVGRRLAERLALAVGDRAVVHGRAGERELELEVTGILETGGREDEAFVVALASAQRMAGLAGRVSEAEISALTTPENELARRYAVDPSTLTPAEYERWTCTPYPGSVAADIQNTIPGSAARVVRQVAETQGALYERIDGLMLLLGTVGLLACCLSVLGVLTSAVVDRRSEVALLQALGAGRTSVLALFFTEAGVIGILGGLLASLTGVVLGGWLLATVFGTIEGGSPLVLGIAPALGLAIALVASAWPVWRAVQQDTAPVLQGG